MNEQEEKWEKRAPGWKIVCKKYCKRLRCHKITKNKAKQENEIQSQG